jgi:TfoX/Sxy family transcriptional regulator of competence genes
MAYDQEIAARVRRLLGGRPDIKEKEMMGGLTFLVDGHIACSVSGRGGMLIRVGAEAMDRVLKEQQVHPAVMGARAMTGFVRVDPEAYRTDAALKKWIQRGLDIVAAIPATKPAAKIKRPNPSQKRRDPG